MPAIGIAIASGEPEPFEAAVAGRLCGSRGAARYLRVNLR
jgi:hypothetical protein